MMSSFVITDARLPPTSTNEVHGCKISPQIDATRIAEWQCRPSYPATESQTDAAPLQSMPLALTRHLPPFVDTRVRAFAGADNEDDGAGAKAEPECAEQEGFCRATSGPSLVLRLGRSQVRRVPAFPTQAYS
uniref:Uncharacterized protein n=1 Tax=Mycena chlorophos TaxID=658473 RepID=A0ABQ0LC17_MYCCL|nr:predicted protein [Mycena chlorophos]